MQVYTVWPILMGIAGRQNWLLSHSPQAYAKPKIILELIF